MHDSGARIQVWNNSSSILHPIQFKSNVHMAMPHERIAWQNHKLNKYINIYYYTNKCTYN